MAVETPTAMIPLLAAGAQVVVRDEEWLVTSTRPTPSDGVQVNCMGTSTLVRDTAATFFTNLDLIEPLRPEETTFVHDASPQFRSSRLYLEAMIRKTPVPATETGLAVADRQLLDELDYQRRATHKALAGLRPRLLIADAVGLGKTLEVGLILSELIRRGRGDKILVVTPRHILEQFQHELWTRFAIPLTRLDSEGLQRVRRHIPANRNPFTHYKRSIISIDTVKSDRYRHHLESIRWDAVVIDECHNLVNKGTLNNRLARTLAPNTEALLLTSATPHNGDPESFAELVRLLDPTAIADPKKIVEKDIAHLYVRRHKHHDDVAAEVAENWAEREDPKPILVDASPAENALLAELSDTWIHPLTGAPPTSGRGRSLFPWTLFKAAMSSHRALAETIEQRRKTLHRKAGDNDTSDSNSDNLTADQKTEDDALATLGDLCAKVDDVSSSKLAALIANLKEIGVGPRSKTRVVIFSERIATLDWLAEVVPAALKLKPKNIAVLHGRLADVKQMDVIEDFGLADSDVRLLFTGDMASEGVNLHRQCHHLIHFDLPWSLITIEQRNGRIDRYGQQHAPDVRALLLSPDHPHLTGDIRIITKLLEREHEAHKAFGDSGTLLGLHDVKLEEEAIIERLEEEADADSAIPTEPEAGSFDLLTLLAGHTGSDEVATFSPPTLFPDENAFVDEALREGFGDARTELDMHLDQDHPEMVSLAPPSDLVNRFRALPQSYLAEQKVAERLLLTGDDTHAQQQLDLARESTTSSWPTVGYLSPLHPFVDWLVDKVLVAHGRNEAPVIVADVDQPWVCIQGHYANGLGQPQLVEWMAVTDFHGQMEVRDLFTILEGANVTPDMANPGAAFDTGPLTKLLDGAIDAARTHLDAQRLAYDNELAERLLAPTERLELWMHATDAVAADMVEHRQRDLRKQMRDVADDTRQVIEQMKTTGQPLIRVLAALVPRSHQ